MRARLTRDHVPPLPEGCYRRSVERLEGDRAELRGASHKKYLCNIAHLYTCDKYQYLVTIGDSAASRSRRRTRRRRNVGGTVCDDGHPSPNRPRSKGTTCRRVGRHGRGRLSQCPISSSVRFRSARTHGEARNSRPAPWQISCSGDVGVRQAHGECNQTCLLPIP